MDTQPPPPPPGNNERRKGKGRQKIEIKRIENKNERLVTFSKRRFGIYKKANELVTLTGSEVAFGVFSPAGKPFSFAHPSMEAVANRFLGQDQAQDETQRLAEAYRTIEINELNQQYNKMNNQLELQRDRFNEIKEKLKGRTRGWWSTPVDQLSLEALMQNEKTYNNILAILYNKLKEKNQQAMAAATQSPGGGSTSYAPPLPPAVEYFPQMMPGGVGFSCPPPVVEYYQGQMMQGGASSSYSLPPPAPTEYYHAQMLKSNTSGIYPPPPPPPPPPPLVSMEQPSRLIPEGINSYNAALSSPPLPAMEHAPQVIQNLNPFGMDLDAIDPLEMMLNKNLEDENWK